MIKNDDSLTHLYSLGCDSSIHSPPLGCGVLRHWRISICVCVLGLDPMSVLIFTVFFFFFKVFAITRASLLLFKLFCSSFLQSMLLISPIMSPAASCGSDPSSKSIPPRQRELNSWRADCLPELLLLCPAWLCK